MLSILGWKLSVDKLVNYSAVCKVLGIEFGFKMSGDGFSLVCNADDRVSELCENLKMISYKVEYCAEQMVRDPEAACGSPVACSCLEGPPETTSAFCQPTSEAPNIDCARTPFLHWNACLGG